MQMCQLYLQRCPHICTFPMSKNQISGTIYLCISIALPYGFFYGHLDFTVGNGKIFKPMPETILALLYTNSSHALYLTLNVDKWE